MKKRRKVSHTQPSSHELPLSALSALPLVDDLFEHVQQDDAHALFVDLGLELSG